MKKNLFRVVFFLVLFLPLAVSVLVAGTKPSAVSAVEGVIRGKVQKVGFRAFIFRQAIQYNLGGVIKNRADGTVHFELQGESEFLHRAVSAIQTGPARADILEVEIKPIPVQSKVTSVTVKGWTSTSRGFEHPVDLVYPLRSGNLAISEGEAHEIYRKIIASAIASA